ncbi:hypothetical protein RvY_05126 [Ramazzottius varieornatus]|uniref:Uncharacterized protein n=1 Tax=Ramazzottius varieornatus TaxID=947166 RepID=A0A1D1UX21_RAMVA|nr:hypothetical protein RvY_05126 [Ramazzottius varieornatus]
MDLMVTAIGLILMWPPGPAARSLHPIASASGVGPNTCLKVSCNKELDKSRYPWE